MGTGTGARFKAPPGTCPSAACALPCPTDTAGADPESLLQQKVAMTILEGNRTAIDQLTGTVSWRKKVGSSSHPTHIVGIVFDPMAEETEMALNAFCTISNGEQDMIWNLWNSSGTTLKSGGSGTMQQQQMDNGSSRSPPSLGGGRRKRRYRQERPEHSDRHGPGRKGSGNRGHRRGPRRGQPAYVYGYPHPGDGP